MICTVRREDRKRGQVICKRGKETITRRTCDMQEGTETIKIRTVYRQERKGDKKEKDR